MPTPHFFNCTSLECLIQFLKPLLYKPILVHLSLLLYEPWPLWSLLSIAFVNKIIFRNILLCDQLVWINCMQTKKKAWFPSFETRPSWLSFARPCLPCLPSPLIYQKSKWQKWPFPSLHHILEWLTFSCCLDWQKYTILLYCIVYILYYNNILGGLTDRRMMFALLGNVFPL